ncbi:unnamed protein product [Lampetra planeri]
MHAAAAAAAAGWLRDGKVRAGSGLEEASHLHRRGGDAMAPGLKVGGWPGRARIRGEQPHLSAANYLPNSRRPAPLECGRRDYFFRDPEVPFRKGGLVAPRGMDGGGPLLRSACLIAAAGRAGSSTIVVVVVALKNCPEFALSGGGATAGGGARAEIASGSADVFITPPGGARRVMPELKNHGGGDGVRAERTPIPHPSHPSGSRLEMRCFISSAASDFQGWSLRC